MTEVSAGAERHAVGDAESSEYGNNRTEGRDDVDAAITRADAEDGNDATWNNADARTDGRNAAANARSDGRSNANARSDGHRSRNRWTGRRYAVSAAIRDGYAKRMCWGSLWQRKRCRQRYLWQGLY